MVALGRYVPLQTQVTIELTGRMLPGTEIGAALTVLDAMQVDVVGLNCATGPVEMSEALRHLSGASRVHRVRAQCGPPVGGRRQHALRPHPRRPGRAPAPLRDRVRRVRHRRVLRDDAGPPGRGRRPLLRATPAARQPVHEPSAASIYTSVPFVQDSSSWLSASARTPTAPRPSARPCSMPTGTPASAWRGTRSRRARTSSTCAWTTRAPTAWRT